MIRISFKKRHLKQKNQEIFNGQLKEIEKLVKVNFDGTSFKIFFSPALDIDIHFTSDLKKKPRR